MARAHPVSTIVIELTRKEGVIVGLGLPPRLGLAGEPLLYLLPAHLAYNRGMEAVVDLPFVAQSPDIDRVR
jgi:hypothetical protein